MRGMKVEALEYGDRRVFSVASFNKGVATWIARLPTVWVEGEVTELRRHERWASVFFTLKDPEDGACLPASKRDVLSTIGARFPPARVVVAETYVQGPKAAPAIVEALRRLCDEPEVDVLVLAHGGGSFEDLLPFSEERLVRAVAASPVPIVSAVGHEQDTPLCDLAADVRASTPTAAGRLVVPDLSELLEGLGRSRSALQRSVRRSLDREPALALERKRASLEHRRGRLRALSPRSTLARGYAIVRAADGIVTTPPG